MSSTVQLLYKQHSEMCTISQRLNNIKDEVKSVWVTDVLKLNKLRVQAEECDGKAKTIKQRLEEVLESNLYEVDKNRDLFLEISKVSAQINEDAKYIINKIEDKNIFGDRLNEVMESLMENTARVASFIVRKMIEKIGPAMQSIKLPYSLQKYLP